jgi:ribonuclease-3
MSETIVDRMRAAAGDLWGRAMTHASAGSEHNQRLEFLGNAVLDLAIADHVYERFPEREGRLSAMCSYLRSDLVLNEVGRRIGIDEIVQIVPRKDGGVADSIVAGAVEAAIGAVFERNGYGSARSFVEELLLAPEMIDRAEKYRDPVTELKELAEARRWEPISRGFDEMLGEKMVFYRAIELNGKAVLGMGSSKRAAEAQAARLMLSAMNDGGAV